MKRLILIPYGDNDFWRIMTDVGALILLHIEEDNSLYDKLKQNPILIHDYIKSLE